MTVSHQPLVSVVTPVYNGERYLRECIESVLQQTYPHWEYIIADNVSDDATLRIAEEYVGQDNRIRIYRNDVFLPIMANHNHALEFISRQSAICKIVSADDRIMPNCLQQMVDLFDGNPSVGIAGSYQVVGGDGRWRVRNEGLPCFKSVFPGREIGRAHLLGEINVLGNPTSSCYRADLVREGHAFFPNDTTEADVSACLAQLRTSDFGFVHQVLSYERCHEARQTNTALATHAYVSAAISDCMVYGMAFLTSDEQDARIAQLLSEYYHYLSVNALKFRERSFWRHHKERLRDIGYPFDQIRFTKEVMLTIADLSLNPKATLRLLHERMRTPSGRGQKLASP
jgi:glycosyltransferase involved in cell wall biosynthesis